MTKATIDGVTGLAGKWSTPVQVTAEDGVDGEYMDFKFCKNNSETIAPELTNNVRYPEGWEDDPPKLLAGEFIWMTKATIDGNKELKGLWSAPVRISGEKGYAGDWTSYVFKAGESCPARPTGSESKPAGWEDGPGSTGRWWMSKAMISGITGLAGKWSTPIQVTGIDGQDGEYVVYEYAVNYSETVAPSSGWSRGVPSKGVGQYLWMRWGTVVPPAVGPVSWEGLARVTGEKGEQGDPGLPGRYTKLAYRYGFTRPVAPQSFMHEGWMDTPDKEKVEFTHGSVFSLKDGWYVSPKIVDNGFVKNRVSFSTTQPNQTVFINLKVSSERSDYAFVGKLDDGGLGMNFNYLERISGDTDKVIGVLVPSAGSHFIEVGYGKDSSLSAGEDCCRYRMTDCEQCWLSTCECTWVEVGYVAGSWTTPVVFLTDTPDKEEVYLVSDSEQKPERPETAAYMDDFVPALTKTEYRSSVTYGVGNVVRSGDEFYVCLKGNSGEALTNREYWKKVRGWTDNPTGVSSVYPYEYVCTRKKTDGRWGDFSSPIVWAKFGQDGEDGKDGQDGQNGKDGMICRVSEWAAGVYYRNDRETETDGLRYLDVAVVSGAAGGFECYEATKAHNGVAATEANKPGNTIFWTRMSELPPVYTPLLLAENGVIRFAQSNELVIQRKDGTVTAGMSGAGTGENGIRIWAGGSDPAKAPFRVDENGKMVADKAEISGTIKAIDGVIGGFKIENNGLSVGNAANGVIIKPTTLSIRYQDSYVGTVVSKIFAELGATSYYLENPPFYFYKKHSSSYYIPTMEIVSDNAAKVNVALRTSGNIVSKNAIIEAGYARVKASEYTQLNLRSGTKFEIYNTVNRFMYFPEASEVQAMCGGSFPASVVIDVVAHHSNTERFALKFYNGGTLYDRGGNSVESYEMKRGNSVSFLLVYESSSVYYAQIMQQNY